MIRDAALLVCCIAFCQLRLSTSVGRIPVARGSTHRAPDDGEQVLGSAAASSQSVGAPLLSMGWEDRDEDELFHDVVLLQVRHKLQRSISTVGASAIDLDASSTMLAGSIGETDNAGRAQTDSIGDATSSPTTAVARTLAKHALSYTTVPPAASHNERSEMAEASVAVGNSLATDPADKTNHSSEVGLAIARAPSAAISHIVPSAVTFAVDADHGISSAKQPTQAGLATEVIGSVSSSSFAPGPPRVGPALAPATPTEILAAAGGPADTTGLQSLWWKMLPASVLSTHRVLQHIARAFARSPGASGWAVLALAFVIWLMVMLECCRFGFAGSEEQPLQDRSDDGPEVSGETVVVSRPGKKAIGGPRGPQTLVGDIARRASERRQARSRGMGCC